MKLFVVTALATIVSFASAQDVAAHRAEALRRGVNTSLWFSQAGHYDVHTLRTFTTEDDIKLIHQLGFDHIRLPVDAKPLLSWQHGDDDGKAYMVELDRIVSAILANHLSIIVDLHPESSYKKALLTGDDTLEQFSSLWSALSEHFAASDPEHLYFELINEPEQTDAHRLRIVESAAITAIRKSAPHHTIIAATLNWEDVDDLLRWQPFDDPNVIYTFHDYNPFAFTHQGATWTGQPVAPLRGVPYPSKPENVAPLLKLEPNLQQQYWLAKYGFDRWDAQRVDLAVSFAQQWADANHVPVYCGEFGSFRKFANPADRARWIHDTRIALEKHGIGWAMWDYQDEFGAVHKAGGVATPDTEVLKALGLKPLK